MAFAFALGAMACAGDVGPGSAEAPDASVGTAPAPGITNTYLAGSCATVPLGTKVWWTGDGFPGHSSGSMDLVYDGGDYVAGKAIQAFHFDGRNYALAAGGDSATCANTSDCSLMAWVRRMPGGTGDQSIMEFHGANRHFEFYVNAAGHLVYRVNSVPVVTVEGATNVADGAWHFVVLNLPNKLGMVNGNAAGPVDVYVDNAVDAHADLVEYQSNTQASDVDSLACNRRSSPGIDIDEPTVGRALTVAKIDDIWTSAEHGMCRLSTMNQCGDGVVTATSIGASEECDDGNLVDGDGCNSVCQIERPGIDGLVNRWRLDEASSGNTTNVLHDRDTPTGSSLGPNGAALPGSPWGPGSPGFTGAAGSMVSGSPTWTTVVGPPGIPDRRENHVGQGAFSIAFRANVGTSNGRDWFSKTGLLPLGNSIKISLGASGTDIGFLAGLAGTDEVHATVPTLVGAGWKHVAAVREADGTLRLYLDCVQVASLVHVAANVTNLNGMVFTTGPASQLQDMSFFRVALTPAQVCLVKDGLYTADSDGDGVRDGVDACPLDPAKSVSAGQCGCGVSDVDTDADGTADCNDECDTDPGKTVPGVCGCDVSDADGDGDGTPDCHDACATDPNKTAPGQCGCGVADTDTDGDGTADCHDACASDPNKTAPGTCGCGVADTDTDGDGFPNCIDACPIDPAKTVPGQCGCGVSDVDTDGDGTADCHDTCPLDPFKIAPGVCGCGTADLDGDGDGFPDCIDACPADPAKTVPGQCGCGVADTDSDNDGTPNCHDACPVDPNKTAPGQCGCGVADTDTDGDGTADCHDACASDPNKTAPGTCGCGVADTDGDGDGVPNCVDNCPTVPNPGQQDSNGNGIGDACEVVTLPAAEAAYAFDAGSGSVAADSTCHHNGTINGAQWVTSSPAGSSFGKALRFRDGKKDSVQSNTFPTSTNRSKLTLSAWTNATTNPAGGEDGVIAARATSTKGWRIKTSPDVGHDPTQPHYACELLLGNSGTIQINSVAIRHLGESHHVTCVYDGTSVPRRLDIYVDGLLSNGTMTGETTVIPASFAEPAAGTAFNIGRDSSGFMFWGLIDNVRVYYAALTGNQVSVDMTTPIGPPACP